MRISRTLLSLAAVIAALGASAAQAGTAVKSDSLAGRWDANITLNGGAIPFRLDISGDGVNLQGTLFNGDQLQTTTSARLENGAIVLDFDHYLTKIVATLNAGRLDGEVEGRFERERYISSVPFHAKRYLPASVSSANVPSIDGVWEIPYDSPKGEKAWRFIVHQSGPEVSASILRVDGDTGALTGNFQNGKFVLSHFDGSRPLLLEVTLANDGSLEILPSGAYTNAKKLIAYRPEAARAKGLPEPANYTSHTTVRDPNEAFAFRFPDVNGNIVSNDESKFKGKVVLAIVTGTWCPNCHDEAQYLVQLYKKYRDQGLEIVALDFEEPEQQDTLSRERAFVKTYGVEYTYLIAGAPAEMWEKVPQALNLNTWPATFFIGRDGRVNSIHAGFASRIQSPTEGRVHVQH
jgi:thiol-disulfide isomerase/thioredoxin